MRRNIQGNQVGNHQIVKKSMRKVGFVETKLSLEQTMKGYGITEIFFSGILDSILPSSESVTKCFMFSHFFPLYIKCYLSYLGLKNECPF